MNVIKINDTEILEDGNRYYILNGWNIEIYNSIRYEVPKIKKEITKQEYDMIEKQYLREKKMVRILKDDTSQLIKKIM